MLQPPLPPLVQAFAPEFARRFAGIMAMLVAIIARRFLRDPRLIPLSIPLCGRLNRAVRRFTRLMAQVATGCLPQPRPHRPGTPASPSPGKSPGAIALPTARGWFLHVLGYEGVACGSQLQALMAEPGAAEVLAQVPGARRILNWLVRLLTVGPRPRPLRSVPVAPGAPVPTPAPIPAPSPAPKPVRAPAPSWAPRPTQTPKAEDFDLFDEVAFRGPNYTWYEAPTPPLKRT